jgi:hypothetical protein
MSVRGAEGRLVREARGTAVLELSCDGDRKRCRGEG